LLNNDKLNRLIILKKVLKYIF